MRFRDRRHAGALLAEALKPELILKPYALQYADQSYLEREAARQKEVIRKRH
jgi:putative phosphoribosyl transferase